MSAGMLLAEFGRQCVLRNLNATLSRDKDGFRCKLHDAGTGMCIVNVFGESELETACSLALLHYDLAKVEAKKRAEKLGMTTD